jgi:Putative rhamnosyl transferase
MIRRTTRVIVVVLGCALLPCRLYRSGWSMSTVQVLDPWPDYKALPAHIPYYSPTIRKNISKQDWDFGPLVHIVKTRLMQHQGNLTALGQARLALFRVFCLPTMVHQSKSNFLWFIRVDPNLDPSLLASLIRLVSEQQHHANIYVIASNENPRFRGGEETRKLAQSKVYTGNRDRLEIAVALHDQFPILETRLDADDGLHIGYLQFIQETVRQTSKSHPKLQWMFWCVHSHLEWFWMDNQSTLPPNVTLALQDDLLTFGSWRVVQNRYCMTPGLSTFFGVTTKVWQVPYTGHSKLFKVIQGLDGVDNRNISNCGLPQTADCIQFVQPFVLDAIRSRSPTSAGVRAIQPVAKELQRYNTLKEVQYYRNTALESFAVSGASLQWINQLMAEHVIDVASDNVRGQCTHGHSCDERASEQLQQLVHSRSSTPTPE